MRHASRACSAINHHLPLLALGQGHNPQVKCYFLHFSPIKCIIHRGVAKVELLQRIMNTQVNICTNNTMCFTHRGGPKSPGLGGRAQWRAVGQLLMVISPCWDLTQLCWCPQRHDVCPDHVRQHIFCWELQSVQAVALWKEVSLETGSQGCSLWYSVCVGGLQESEGNSKQ